MSISASSLPDPREHSRANLAVLLSTGRRKNPATLDRIRSTLGAAALAEQTRDALKAGRLTDEVEAVRCP
jgi:hypothetical protein